VGTQFTGLREAGSYDCAHKGTGHEGGDARGNPCQREVAARSAIYVAVVQLMCTTDARRSVRSSVLQIIVLT
jgi:hypothetical protein